MVGTDFAAGYVPYQAIPSQSVSGTVNGTGRDCSGFDEVNVLLDAGAVTGAGTLDVKIQESDVLGSGYADIVGAAFTQVVNANQNALYMGRIKMVGRKRYLRAVAVQATAAALGAVHFLLCQAKSQPAQTPQWTV